MYERDFNVVFFDLPGFGKEPLVQNDWGVPEYANWVKNRLNKIEGKKILLGHSFGGRIATFIAGQNPEWLEGLILSGSPSIYRPTRKIKYKILLSKFIRKIGLKKKFMAPRRFGYSICPSLS
jgi:pimeloyl-ACP methyl ester carboxylesterase